MKKNKPDDEFESLSDEAKARMYADAAGIQADNGESTATDTAVFSIMHSLLAIGKLGELWNDSRPARGGIYDEPPKPDLSSTELLARIERLEARPQMVPADWLAPNGPTVQLPPDSDDLIDTTPHHMHEASASSCDGCLALWLLQEYQGGRLRIGSLTDELAAANEHIAALDHEIVELREALACARALQDSIRIERDEARAAAELMRPHCLNPFVKDLPWLRSFADNHEHSYGRKFDGIRECTFDGCHEMRGEL